MCVLYFAVSRSQKYLTGSDRFSNMQFTIFWNRLRTIILKNLKNERKKGNNHKNDITLSTVNVCFDVLNTHYCCSAPICNPCRDLKSLLPRFEISLPRFEIPALICNPFVPIWNPESCPYLQSLLPQFLIPKTCPNL